MRSRLGRAVHTLLVVLGLAAVPTLVAAQVRPSGRRPAGAAAPPAAPRLVITVAAVRGKPTLARVTLSPLAQAPASVLVSAAQLAGAPKALLESVGDAEEARPSEGGYPGTLASGDSATLALETGPAVGRGGVALRIVSKGRALASLVLRGLLEVQRAATVIERAPVVRRAAAAEECCD